MAKKDEIITLKLDLYPMVVNKQGRKYTRKAYDEIIQSIKNGIEDTSSDLPLVFLRTDIKNERVGVVQSINADVTPPIVDIKLLKDIDTKRKQVSLSLYSAPKITIDDLHGDRYSQYILVDRVKRVLALTIVSNNK